MNSQGRNLRIESFGNGYNELVEAIKRYPKEIWQFRDEHGCWSIHEHIVHMADAEANSYVWCRSLIAQPDQTLAVFHEDLWAKPLAYHEQNVDHALDLFRSLRAQNYSLIKSLPEHVWANTAHHPQYGNVNLDAWLRLGESHVREHLQFMQENYDAWMTQKQ